MKPADTRLLKRRVGAAAEMTEREATADGPRAHGAAANAPAGGDLADVAVADAPVARRAPPAADAAAPRSAALRYYEAIERASAEMLAAARGGDWDAVVKLEGACALLISQLKHAAAAEALDGRGAQLKSVIMQRILLNDAEIRHLAEPWLDELDNLLAGRSKTLH